MNFDNFNWNSEWVDPKLNTANFNSWDDASFYTFVIIE